VVNQQRSLPRLNGCVTFDADAVRVGDTRVPCRAEQGSVVVVLGDRLRPLTLGERELALSLGAEGLARAVWQLSGGNAALSRSIEEQAVVEAVALYLAGAANTAGLHLAVVVAGLYLGDPARAQALGAAIADDLAASAAAGVPERHAEPGWTVLRIGADDRLEDAGEDLRDPAVVRAALVAALLERAELPVPPELADSTPVDPTSAVPPLGPASRAAAAPVLTPGDAPAAVAPERLQPSGARPAADFAPLPVASSTAASAAMREPVAAVVASSRFPAWSPSEPERVVPELPGAAWTFTVWPAPLHADSRTLTGVGWGPRAAGVVESRSQDLTGIDWQAPSTLGWRPTRGLATDDRPGPRGEAGRSANTAWPRHAGAREEALGDSAFGLSVLAEHLLAVADRRGLA